MSNAFMSNDLGQVFEKAFPFGILVPDQKSGNVSAAIAAQQAPHPLFSAAPLPPRGDTGGGKLAAIPTRVAQTAFAFFSFFDFSRIVWKNAESEIHLHWVRGGV